jgi:hypothetical protein
VLIAKFDCFFEADNFVEVYFGIHDFLVVDCFHIQQTASGWM